MPRFKIKKREFLTKPSSFAKLGVLIAVSGLIIWINVQSNRKTGIGNRGDQNNGAVGEVAGAVSQRAEAGEQPTKVQTSLERIIGKADDFETLLKTGKEFLDRGEFDGAILAFERASEVAPDYRDVWYLLGFSRLKKFEQTPSMEDTTPTVNDADRAVIALTRAQAIDPQSETVKELLNIAKQAQSRQ